MITDVVTVQSARVKTQIIKFNVQSSMFKVQCSKFNVQSSMFKVQCSKDKSFSVIREIRSRLRFYDNE